MLKKIKDYFGTIKFNGGSMPLSHFAAPMVPFTIIVACAIALLFQGLLGPSALFIVTAITVVPWYWILSFRTDDDLKQIKDWLDLFARGWWVLGFFAVLQSVSTGSNLSVNDVFRDMPLPLQLFLYVAFAITLFAQIGLSLVLVSRHK